MDAVNVEKLIKDNRIDWSGRYRRGLCLQLPNYSPLTSSRRCRPQMEDLKAPDIGGAAWSYTSGKKNVRRKKFKFPNYIL